MERRGGKRAGAGRKTSTIKRDRVLFIRCTAEERQEIKIKLNILKKKLKCQTLVETVLVLINKEISKNNSKNF